MGLQARQASLDIAARRGKQRRTLRLSVNASVAGVPARTIVHNISETGLLIETDIDLPVGETIDVELPDSAPRSAKVLWNSENLFGCRFEDAISPATVSASVLRSPFDTAPAPETRPVQRDDEDNSEKLPLPVRFWIIVGATTGLWAIIGLAATLLV